MVHFVDRIAVSNDVSQIVKSHHLWLVTGYCLAMGVVSQLRIVHHAMNGRGEGAGNGCMGAATGEYSSLFSLEGAKYDKI